MATPEIIVEPRASAGAPAPAPVEAPVAEEAAAGGLPEELHRLPAIQGLLAGSPAAFSASLTTFAKRPEGKLIGSNIKPLQEHGIGLYRSLDGDTGVLFNQLKISGDQIKAADAAGTLLELAPSFDEVNATVSANGVPEVAPPTGAAAAPVPTAPQMAQAPLTGIKPPSAAAQKKMTTARVENVKPGSPTSGPKPGSGRLLNQILKPVI